MSIYAWHFTDGNKLRDGTPLPAVGEWLEYEGEVRICRSGYHYSLLPSDALLYAPGIRCIWLNAMILSKHTKTKAFVVAAASLHQWMRRKC